MRTFIKLAAPLLNFFGIASSAPPPANGESAREAGLKRFFLERCSHFRLLLAANKAGLEDMNKLETLAEDGRADASAVKEISLRIAEKVREIVRHLNALSDNAYPELHRRLDEILAELSGRLEKTASPPPRPAVFEDLPLTVRFGTPEAARADLCGAKMAKLARHALCPPLPGIRVPRAFVATTRAFHLFMEHRGLGGDIALLLRELHAAPEAKRPEDAEINSEFARLRRISSAIRGRILRASLPPRLERRIVSEAAVLEAEAPGCLLVVRSSAPDEDGEEHSFAGQYTSLLRVPPADAVSAWKEVLASLYGFSALSYRTGRGIRETGARAMCAGFLIMLDEVRAGGVAYSADPLAPDDSVCVVNAAAGLPESVVDGSITPDLFRIDPGPPPRVTEHVPGRGNNAAAVDTEQALAVARLAFALQAEQGCPQDVEWAFDKEGALNLLQSRPLAMGGTRDTDGREKSLPHALPLLLSGGTPAAPGIGSGPAHLVHTDGDMARFPSGGVLVVGHALPKWAPLLSKAAALIGETGGTTGHLAGVAREYGLPALVGMRGIISVLREQADPHPPITVDARGRAVYLGIPPDAPIRPAGGADAARGPLPPSLKAVTDIILPLHLLDPGAEDFSPAGCRTLHDITRFCHEKSVEAMFETQQGRGGKRKPPGKQLKAGAKLKYWLLDMGGGFADGVTTLFVDIRQIRSLPMLALWNGMTAVPWAGPPAPDGRGFLTVLARSISNPELDPLMANSMAERNYFLVSRSFCNLQTRIGYHFCTAEAEAGETEHANYASFHFKGGAASMDRRALRVRLMADILQEHGFAASVRKDALFAHAEGAAQKDILDKTRILGYLLIHTRQVDMIMRNAGMVAELNAKLRADIRALLAAPLRLPK
jgi:pyruvate,water dikinase